MPERIPFYRNDSKPQVFRFAGHEWTTLEFSIRERAPLFGGDYIMLAPLRCPKCGKTVSFRVGSGGTSERFFEVSCS